MIDELDYETASMVIESWEALRCMENYAPRTGRGLLVRFFAEEPAAKAVFGFDNAPKRWRNNASVYDSEEFLDVAKNLMDIVEQAVDMLGPDLQVLAEVLIELGEKYHREYGMEYEYYGALGKALIDQLEEMLGPQGLFGIRTKSCWLQVYGALTRDMAALNLAAAAKADRKKPEQSPDRQGETCKHRRRRCCLKRRT
mmetsp:Transcript_3507/g.9271  ORF Transcript_3507/g.9271 Transcript_3507/m.9271 type:complete len:198 (+) Transcript_3507:166-759(+)